MVGVRPNLFGLLSYVCTVTYVHVVTDKRTTPNVSYRRAASSWEKLAASVQHDTPPCMRLRLELDVDIGRCCPQSG